LLNKLSTDENNNVDRGDDDDDDDDDTDDNCDGDGNQIDCKLLSHSSLAFITQIVPRFTMLES